MSETTTTGFDEYLPLSARRLAPGEYVIETKSGDKLWVMAGRSLAEWICASMNSHAELLAAAQNAANFLGKLPPLQGYGEYKDLLVAIKAADYEQASHSTLAEDESLLNSHQSQDLESV